MYRVITWMRAVDEENFAAHLAPHDVQLINARTQPADLAAANGLLLTGGPDISLNFLRQEVADPSVIDADSETDRDAWEFTVLPKALAAGLPIFAVCKGVQVLNVALGGTLHLDIPGHAGPHLKYSDVQPLRFSQSATHRLPHVNSSHHQALDQLGDGLEIEAWCATDNIVEQVRLRDYPYAFGMQYHPERGAIYAPLFAEFAEAIAAGAQGKIL